MKKLSLYVFLF